MDLSRNSRFRQNSDCNDAKMTLWYILCPDCDSIIQYNTQTIHIYYQWHVYFFISISKRERPILWKVNSQTTNQFSEDGRSRRLKEQAAKFCHDINKLRERTNNRQRDLDSVSHLIFFARGIEYDYKMNWFRYI